MVDVALIRISIKPGQTAPFAALFKDGEAPGAWRGRAVFACEIGEVNTFILAVPFAPPDRAAVHGAADAVMSDAQLAPRLRSLLLEHLRSAEAGADILSGTRFLIVHRSPRGSEPPGRGDFDVMSGVLGTCVTLLPLATEDDAIAAAIELTDRKGGASELYRKIA